MTWPAITQQPKWGGDSLQIDNLGVLEGGCESDHTRHVPAGVSEEVIGQAVSEWVRVNTLSGFRSVTLPAVTLLPPNTTTERDLPQRDERLALGQHLGELHCSLWTEPVVIEAATSKGGGTQSLV